MSDVIRSIIQDAIPELVRSFRILLDATGEDSTLMATHARDRLLVTGVEPASEFLDDFHLAV